MPCLRVTLPNASLLGLVPQDHRKIEELGREDCEVVRSGIGGPGGMANRARAQRAAEPLPTNKLDGIVMFAAGSDGMRAIVTPGAVYSAVIF